MKPRENGSGPGGSSRHLHHKHFNKSVYAGDDTVSTGQRVTEWTARECETRRVGGTRPKKQKK